MENKKEITVSEAVSKFCKMKKSAKINVLMEALNTLKEDGTRSINCCIAIAVSEKLNLKLKVSD